jgi:hypothetical protein
MEAFQPLGREIDRLWLEQNYNEDIFPKLSADALGRHELPSKLTAWEVLEWTLRQPNLPRQRDVEGRFGDPPVTVYSGRRFHIDVYFWFHGTTATHQHGFCGAFQVLHGSSIHSWYEFERREVINAFCELGNITLRVCELLEIGAVQEIRPGRQYIHSLFHLDQPSATIVVRTDQSPLELPQFSYHKPSLAIDPFFEDDELTKKLQAMSALVHSKRESADELIKEWFETCDFQTAFNILGRLRGLFRSDQLDKMFRPDAANERFERFLSIVVRRHGRKGEELRAVFSRFDMLDEIMRLRGYVTDPEHRFFMALLLNVDGRDQVFQLIKQRYPDADPLEKILDWVFDLGQTRIIGSDGANALGIPGFGEAEMFALEQMLHGSSDEEIRSAFGCENPGCDPAVSDLAISRLREAIIFRPLPSARSA